MYKFGQSIIKNLLIEEQKKDNKNMETIKELRELDEIFGEKLTEVEEELEMKTNSVVKITDME